MIAENLTQIRNRIDEAASRVGRNPDRVRIVAAGKKQGRDKIRAAIEAGIRIIGHNYVQEAEAEKEDAHSAKIELHMIGHLQKNKAGKAAELFDVIETVDNAKLVKALSRRAGDTGRNIGVLIQGNLALEPQK